MSSDSEIALPVCIRIEHPDPLFAPSVETPKGKNLIDDFSERIRIVRERYNYRELGDAVAEEKRYRTLGVVINLPPQRSEAQFEITHEEDALSCSASTEFFNGQSEDSGEIDLPIRLKSNGTSPIQVHRRSTPPEFSWHKGSVSSSIWDSDKSESGSNDDGYTTTATPQSILGKTARRLWTSGFSVSQGIDESKIGSRSTFSSVEVLCPHPSWMIPQLQIIDSVIHCLENQKHGIVESPTGTGKTASILSAVIAWQRHKKLERAFAASKDPSSVPSAVFPQERHTIYYCTRTHSQIAQCLKELRTLPYQPATACLAAAKHLCPYVDVRKDSDEEDASIPAIGRMTARRLYSRENCRSAVSVIEKRRKRRNNRVLSGIQLMTKENLNEGIQCGGCPFYAALDTEEYADRIASQMIPPVKLLTPQSTRGREAERQGNQSTHCGIWDIEDMVCPVKQLNHYWLCSIRLIRKASHPAQDLQYMNDG